MMIPTALVFLKYLTDDALTNSFGRSIQVLRQRNRKKDYQTDNILDGSKNLVNKANNGYNWDF